MTRLEEACAAAIEDPDFVTFMNNNGQAISYLDAQGYADYLKQAAVDVAAAMDGCRPLICLSEYLLGQAVHACPFYEKI